MSQFVMFVGPMFGGKTTRMLSQLERYRYQSKNVFLFKPAIDERYSKAKVVTHAGTGTEAFAVDHGQTIVSTIRRWTADPCVVAVDEAFMIPGSAQALLKLFSDGHTILVSSIQLSAAGEPFEEIKEMMPWATKIEVCPAVCTKCPSDAYFTQKLSSNVEHGIEVGGSELYEPRCLKHFENDLI